MSKPKPTSRPPIRTVVYGPQGTGKSWLLATFGRAYLAGYVPGPLLVSLFDPRGKDAAYLDPEVYQVERKAIQYVSDEFVVGQDARKQDLVIPYTEVYINDTLVTRVEYMHEEALAFDEESDKISGWTVLPKLRKRLNRLFRDESSTWGTYGFDSSTSAELMFRKYHQYVQNPDARGEGKKQWWGGSTDELEALLAIRLAPWRGNLVIICHTDKDRVASESGSVVSRYTPRLPGRLAGDISSYYPEVWHSVAETGEDGETSYSIQTRPSALYGAFSNLVKAPNPCENDYDALWVNWK